MNFHWHDRKQWMTNDNDFVQNNAIRHLISEFFVLLLIFLFSDHKIE